VRNAEIHSRMETLVASATERFEGRVSGKTRVIAHVGHCTLASGAGDVVDSFRQQMGEDAVLIVAGCDGACFAAPSLEVVSTSGKRFYLSRLSADVFDFTDLASASSDEETAVAEFLSPQLRVSLEGCGSLDAESIDHYLATGGYLAWSNALQSSPESVIEEIKASRIRGRGGAYFPAGVKWEGARRTRSDRRYVVVNCEEGEPGLFKDRHLMEGVPHRIIEGALIAAYAVDANDVIFYINAEANLSNRRMALAIEQATHLGLIGKNVLGSGFEVHVEIRRGAGGYVCGDETTLLNTIEGYRREPRLRPPYPTEAGLWGLPTVINNAETLANVPQILSRGADEFATIGDGEDTGTKIVSLSGSVERPGLVEVPFGTTLRDIIYGVGGGIRGGGTLTAIGVGGPSSGVFPPSMLETPIKPGFLHGSGVMLGAGGVIAVDDSMDVVEVVRNLAQYNADESCGKCTPCREGTPRMVALLDAVVEEGASPDELEDLARLVNETSLCGLGQAAGNPILSGLYFFGDRIAGRQGAGR
jgi:NADH:ubiquinone oxidoreductase subunit F (NADH-binding)